MTNTPHQNLFDAAPSAPKRGKNAKRIFEETLVTLTQLAQLIAAKPRALQLWTDAGALRPLEGTDRKGSGAWRLYSRAEGELAAVLAEAHKGFHLPVGVLTSLAGALRRIENETPRNEAFERASRGAHAVWLVAAPKSDGFEISFATGTVISLSATPHNGGGSLRDCGAILVVNLTAALGRLGTI